MSSDPHIVFSSHARREAERRKIPQLLVLSVVESPEQVVDETAILSFSQSIVYGSDGKRFLLRVLVNTNKNPKVVVTVYKTSKIEKYWRTSR